MERRRSNVEPERKAAGLEGGAATGGPGRCPEGVSSGSDGWPTGVSGALQSIVSEERRHEATRERSEAWAQGMEGGEAARGPVFR